MMFQSFNPYKTFHEKQFFSLQFLRIRFIVYKEVLAAAPLFVTEWHVRGALLRVFGGSFLPLILWMVWIGEDNERLEKEIDRRQKILPAAVCDCRSHDDPDGDYQFCQHAG